MRKLISLALGLALASTVLVAIPASAEPAVVLRDQGGCAMPGADSNGEMILGGVGTVTHLVQKDDRATTTCKGTDLANDSGRAQHFSGFTCYSLTVSGTLAAGVGSATISKSGNGTLKCVATRPTE